MVVSLRSKAFVVVLSVTLLGGLGWFTPSPLSAAEPEDQAAGQAAAPASDPPSGVELSDARTESSQTFDLGNGQRRTEFFADPVFYQPDGGSEWLPIDLDFEATEDGGVARVTKAPVTVTVGAQTDGVVAIEHDGRRIALRPIPLPDAPSASEAPAAPALDAILAEPVAAGRPAVERQRADVPGVLPGVGLRVFAHAYGSTNFLVVSEPPASNRWSFLVTAPGLTPRAGTDGAIEFADADGKLFATMPAPYAVDSTADELAGSGRTTTDVAYELARVGEHTVVSVTVDPAWLATAVYPVYVDPSVTIYNEGTTGNGDAHVNRGNPNFNYANYQRPDSPFYYEMWLGESPSDSTYYNEAYLNFATGSLEGMRIDSATVEVRPYHQYYNAPTATTTWLRRVTADWAENTITWNNKPAVASGSIDSTGCVEGQQCAFDVTSLVRGWVEDQYPDYGIRLDENGNGPTYWKRLIAAEQGTTTRPRLIVTYHDPVSSVYPASGPTSSRTLTWSTEAAWGQTGYTVEVDDTADFSSPIETATDTASTAMSWGIPLSESLTPGTTYYWRVQARNAYGGWSSWASASFVYDPSLLGDQGHHRYETWDLGGGDTLAVDASTLNAVVTHPIVTLPYRGSSLSLALTYNAQDPDNAGFGRGWRLSHGRRLVLNASGTVTFIDESGARHTFSVPVTAGTVTTYTRPATLYATLVKDTSQAHEFTLTYRGKAKDTFDIVGTAARLVREADRHGNGVDLTYDAAGNLARITDPAGRYVEFTWDTAPSPDRVTEITDWAYVSGGVTQTTSTGARRAYRFFYSGSDLAGWSDPLNTSGSCPTGGSHLTCLVNSAGYLAGVGKTVTYTTFSAGTLGTDTRADTVYFPTELGEVREVQDGEQFWFVQPGVTFTRSAGLVTVVRPGGSESTTRYAVPAAADPYGRITSVKRKLGSSWIEQRTAYDATFPTEPSSITDNYGALLSTPARTVGYTYVAGSLGLVSRMTEPLTPTTNRTTDYTYNANQDVTQQVVALDGSSSTRTITRYCYDAACATNATGLLLQKQIDNYVDGTAGGAGGQAEDVTTSFQYDAYGQRTRETRANYASGGTLRDSRATGYEYDANGNLTKEIANYANGTVTSPGDDVVPNATTNARTDLTTVHTYDTAGNRVSTADPRRAIALAQGQSLNADDYVTRTTHDGLNQATQQQAARSPGDASAPKVASTVYDERASTRTTTDFGGLVTANYFDRAGRQFARYEDPDGGGSAPARQIEQTYWNPDGLLGGVADERQLADPANYGETIYLYDELGRVTDTVSGYDVDSGDGITPATSTTRTSYDALDRQTSVETGYGTASAQLTTYAYDLGGRATETDDEFTCATATYDYRDLALTETSGLTGGTCASGADTKTLTHTYDGLGRRTRTEVTAGAGLGDRTLDAALDGAGNTLSAATRTGGVTATTAFTVNPLDQVAAEARPDGSTAKTNYDAAGNPTDRCYWKPAITVGTCLPADTTSWTNPPSVAASSTYDARNQRTQLVDASTGTTTTYDPAHNYQPAAVYLATGSGREHQSLYGYDDRHRLTSVTHRLCTIGTGHACSTTTPTGSAAYAYDDADNRTQVVETPTGTGAVTRNYCYDALSRLRARQSTSGCTTTSGDETFTYDAAGNRLTAVTGGSTTNQAYTAAGQLCDVEPGAAASCTGGNVGHDSDGNVTSYNGWTYAYDADGRLTRATETATNDKLEFAYDAEGHRTQIREYTAGTLTRTRDLRYQGAAVVEEKVTDAAHPSGATVRTYVTDEDGRIAKIVVPAGETGAGTYLVIWNGHGDAQALHRINADGSVTLANSYTYSTWGTPTTATHNGIADLGFRFLYVGAYGVQWDDFSGLGLHYMQARHYSPRIGRFLQPDPARAEANQYAYGENSPIFNIDPDGTYAKSVAEVRLCRWGMLPACAQAYLLAEWADAETRRNFRRFDDGTQGNAFKHCVWSASCTLVLGEKDAKTILDAHENIYQGRYIGPKKGTNGRDRIMDLFNNRVGRALAASIPKRRYQGPHGTINLAAAKALASYWCFYAAKTRSLRWFRS